MSFNSLISRTLVAICLAAAWFSGAQAQDSQSGDQGLLLEEIIVTAQKREQSLQSIPISIRALSNETLESVGADSLDDVVRLVPSLSMTDMSRGSNNVQIRGLGSNVGNVGTVAIYNDGVISAGRIQSSGTFAEQDSALYDVERVEVLRGPQGTLYGEGSFGGVINIISKRANAEQIESSASVTWSDIENGTADNYNVAGMINLPIAKDKFAVRLVGFSHDRDGYIDAVDVVPSALPLFGVPVPFAPSVLLKEDANTEEVTGGRVMLSLTPSDVFDASLIYKTQKTELGISNLDSPNLIGIANALGGTSFVPEYTQALFGVDFGSENQTDEIVLELNVETPLGLLTSITGYGEIDQESRSGGGGFLPSRLVVSDISALSEELRLSSDNSGSLNWIVGGYFRTVDRDITDTGTPFSASELNQWSIFGQAYWDLSQTVTATFGLRYGEHDSLRTDSIFGLTTVSADFDDVSPKVAFDWQVSDETLLYASAAKGFRAGGTNLDESFGTDPTFERGFDPDEIWNYELGVKTAFWGGKATINAAVFYIDWRDIQIDRAMTSLISGSGLTFIVVNGADAHSSGIEADIFISPADGWEVVLGGSLVEAEFDGGTIDSAFGLGIPLDGLRLPSSPEYLFNASVERTFELGTRYEAYARADYTVRGNSFGDVPNEAPPGGSFRSGRFSSINFRAGIRHSNWEIQAFATNLTDEYASTFTFFDGGFGDVHTVLRPRAVGLNVKYFYN